MPEKSEGCTAAPRKAWNGKWVVDSMLVSLWPTVWCQIQDKHCCCFALSEVWWLYTQGFVTSDNCKSEDTGITTPTLNRQTEENQEFKVIFGYVGVWGLRCIRPLGGENSKAAGWYSSNICCQAWWTEFDLNSHGEGQNPFLLSQWFSTWGLNNPCISDILYIRYLHYNSEQ